MICFKLVLVDKSRCKDKWFSAYFQIFRTKNFKTISKVPKAERLRLAAKPPFTNLISIMQPNGNLLHKNTIQYTLLLPNNINIMSLLTLQRYVLFAKERICRQYCHANALFFSNSLCKVVSFHFVEISSMILSIIFIALWADLWMTFTSYPLTSSGQ